MRGVAVQRTHDVSPHEFWELMEESKRKVHTEESSDAYHDKWWWKKGISHAHAFAHVDDAHSEWIIWTFGAAAIHAGFCMRGIKQTTVKHMAQCAIIIHHSPNFLFLIVLVILEIPAARCCLNCSMHWLLFLLWKNGIWEKSESWSVFCFTSHFLYSCNYILMAQKKRKRTKQFIPMKGKFPFYFFLFVFRLA